MAELLSIYIQMGSYMHREEPTQWNGQIQQTASNFPSYMHCVRLLQSISSYRCTVTTSPCITLRSNTPNAVIKTQDYLPTTFSLHLWTCLLWGPFSRFPSVRLEYTQPSERTPLTTAHHAAHRLDPPGYFTGVCRRRTSRTMYGNILLLLPRTPRMYGVLSYGPYIY